MHHRRVPIMFIPALIAGCLIWAGPSRAQSTNGTYTLNVDWLSSAGGQVGGGNPMIAQTILGMPAAGLTSNATYTLLSGSGQVLPRPVVTAAVTVTGTVNDASASVVVNDVPALITGSTYTATGVLLQLGPNSITSTATDAAGNSQSASVSVYLDLPPGKKTAHCTVEVRGTINDSQSTVTVNGSPAMIAAGEFSAMVGFVRGLNTVIAVATDSAGNSNSAGAQVFVMEPPQGPPRPTVGTHGPALPPFTTAGSVTFGGTKTAGTSIWINGQQKYAADGGTTWTATVNGLVEGDNALLIVAKDAGGVSSTTVSVNIVVDNLPPVVTFQPPAKTNVNPALLSGTVDDSLTTVTILNATLAGSVVANRDQRNFEAAVPLALGSNTIQAQALSPNGYPKTETRTIVLGTIPTVQTLSPSDHSIIYAGDPLTVSATASDAESDPIEYQFMLDGALLRDWSATASTAWTPTLSQLGPRSLIVNVRDAFGGSRANTNSAFVIRKPVQHP